MTPRVVIVGAGFAGLRAARALRRAPVEVILVDRHNYHLFQPLLYQVATAGLEPEEIAKPVRAILRGQRNLDFRLVAVTGVDLAARCVLTSDRPIAYDYLILAVGARTSFFGLANLERHSFDLKDIPGAVRLRMGQTAAENIRRLVAGRPAIRFRYRNPGTLATIGRNAAVARIHGLTFRGFPAWVVWLVVHIIQLIGFRNRLFVLINWAWDYFFYDRAVRLISRQS